MRSVSLDEVRVSHALDVDRTPSGTVFRRYPEWTRPQLPDITVDVVSTMPTGVRLEFLTDTTEIELDALLTFIEIGDAQVRMAAFDLVADGKVVDVRRTVDGPKIHVDTRTGEFSFVPGNAVTIRFENVPAAERFEVWLPQGVVLELRDLRVSDGASIGPATWSGGRRWVHHGSSISHCMEADQPTGTWPAVTSRLAGVDLHNLAVAGQCMLDPFVARTIRDAPADLISLKIGINVVNGDTMRERTFIPALHGFLDTIREGHPTTPLVVASPIFCSVAEDHPGPTTPDADGRFRVVPRTEELTRGALTLRRIRELIQQVIESRRHLGDHHLHYLDGLALFGPDDADSLPDLLHPDSDGYRRIGERFHELAFTAGKPFAV